MDPALCDFLSQSQLESNFFGTLLCNIVFLASTAEYQPRAVWDLLSHHVTMQKESSNQELGTGQPLGCDGFTTFLDEANVAFEVLRISPRPA